MRHFTRALALYAALSSPALALDAASIPVKIPTPWGTSAPGPNITYPIPIPSQISVAPGRASFTDGFPPVTFLPPGAGGVPPSGQDFNGIYNQVTRWLRWSQAGGSVPYDATFQSGIGGYPNGALVASGTTPGKIWRSTVDNNLSNPDTGGANWVDQSGISVGGVLTGSLPNPGLAAGVAASNVGSLGGVLSGTLPNPGMASGAAATNVGGLGGVLNGSLPNPGMAAGAAASNVGGLGGSLAGSLPNPSIANSVTLPGSPTTTTQAVNTNNNTIATTAFANPVSLGGTTGIVKYPGGIIMQWGEFAPAAGITNVGMPFTMTHCYQVIVSAGTAVPTGNFGGQCINGVLFQIYSSVGGFTMHWLVIGD